MARVDLTALDRLEVGPVAPTGRIYSGCGRGVPTPHQGRSRGEGTPPTRLEVITARPAVAPYQSPNARGDWYKTDLSASGIQPSREASDFAKATTDKTANKLTRSTSKQFRIRAHPPVLRSPELVERAKEDVIRGKQIRGLVRANYKMPITNYGLNQRLVGDASPYRRCSFVGPMDPNQLQNPNY